MSASPFRDHQMKAAAPLDRVAAATVSQMAPHLPYHRHGIAACREWLAATAAARPTGPSLHSVDDVAAEGVPVRLFDPGEGARSRPLLAHVHGGGWALGAVANSGAFCGWLARETGCVVGSVEYRLAPEHPFPAAFDDCLTAVGWLSRNAERCGAVAGPIGLLGDSSGANLAAAVAVHARDREGPQIRFQALAYPVTSCDDATESMRLFDQDPAMLTAADMRWFWDLYYPEWRRASKGGGANPYAVPAEADLTGLPPTIVAIAGHDPLRDDGRRFVCRLLEAGVQVRVLEEPSLPHGYLGLADVVPAAAEARAALGRELSSATG